MSSEQRNKKRLALVTGGNKGIGFETCRQLARNNIKVILGARNRSKGEKAAQQLQSEGLDVHFSEIDVSDPKSIHAAIHEIAREHGYIDILINNAAVLLDRNQEIDWPMLKETMETNYYGPYLLCQTLLPGMLKNNYGRIVNISSDVSHFDQLNGSLPTYTISKVAINAMTRILAERVRGHDVLINAVDPGWVKTDMGGPAAPRSVIESYPGIVWAATLPKGGPNGGFFLDGKPIHW